MKRIIGIVPTPSMGKPEDSCFSDFYKVGNNYILRTAEAGCVPVGLTPVNYWLDEKALEACDGFLIQGGSEFHPYHFQVMHHALATGKKYLGICLGSQLIYVYFKLRSVVEEEGYEGDLIKAMCAYLAKQGPGFTFQKRIPDHRGGKVERGNEDAAKHDVDVIPGTLLHRVLGRDRMRLCSYHYMCPP